MMRKRQDDDSGCLQHKPVKNTLDPDSCFTVGEEHWSQRHSNKNRTGLEQPLGLPPHVSRGSNSTPCTLGSSSENTVSMSTRRSRTSQNSITMFQAAPAWKGHDSAHSLRYIRASLQSADSTQSANFLKSKRLQSKASAALLDQSNYFKGTGAICSHPVESGAQQGMEDRNTAPGRARRQTFCGEHSTAPAEAACPELDRYQRGSSSRGGCKQRSSAPGRTAQNMMNLCDGSTLAHPIHVAVPLSTTRANDSPGSATLSCSSTGLNDSQGQSGSPLPPRHYRYHTNTSAFMFASTLRKVESKLAGSGGLRTGEQEAHRRGQPQATLSEPSVNASNGSSWATPFEKFANIPFEDLWLQELVMKLQQLPGAEDLALGSQTTARAEDARYSQAENNSSRLKELQRGNDSNEMSLACLENLLNGKSGHCFSAAPILSTEAVNEAVLTTSAPGSNQTLAIDVAASPHTMQAAEAACSPVLPSHGIFSRKALQITTTKDLIPTTNDRNQGRIQRMISVIKGMNCFAPTCKSK